MRTRYVDFDDRHEDLAERMRALPEAAEDFQKKWELSWLYHENALEGVVYTSQELALGLENQPVADATFMGALRDIRNHKTAIDLVRAEAKGKKLKLNLSMVKKLYETLGAGFEGRSVAEWRKDMPLHRSYFHEIAQPAKIQPALQKVLDLTDSVDFKNAHPIQQAVKVHHGFMQVFPFTDNSGRVARLFASMILFQAGYLPVLRVAAPARGGAPRAHHGRHRERAGPRREALRGGREGEGRRPEAGPLGGPPAGRGAPRCPLRRGRPGRSAFKAPKNLGIPW
jgi:hypothetical protein